MPTRTDRLAPIRLSSSANSAALRSVVASPIREAISELRPALPAGSSRRPISKIARTVTVGVSLLGTASTRTPLARSTSQMGGNSTTGLTPGTGFLLRSKSSDTGRRGNSLPSSPKLSGILRSGALKLGSAAASWTAPLGTMLRMTAGLPSMYSLKTRFTSSVVTPR